MTSESIPVLPNILASYLPAEPVQRIHEQKDINDFVTTQAFDRIMTFVMLLNQSVLQKKISDPCFVSPVSGSNTSYLNFILYISNVFALASATYIRPAGYFRILVERLSPFA